MAEWLSKRRRNTAMVALLAIATLLIFWQVHRQNFVGYDDPVYIYENPQVAAGLTSESVWWAFEAPRLANYQPLTLLSYMADVTFFGMDPGAMKLVNLGFHIANVIFLFILLQRLTGAYWRSALAAALFAIHPLHVEPVVWLSSRKDVLSTLFLLLTLGEYRRYTVRPKYWRYAKVVLWFVLGLLSKPMLVTTPCLMLLLDYWPLGRFSNEEQRIDLRRVRFAVLEKLPFFAITFLASAVTFFAQESGQAVASLANFSWQARIMNALVAYVTYLGRTFWPRNLSPHYPHPGDALPLWQAAMAAALLLAITLLALRLRRNSPFLLFGWLWYLGTLVPVIGLIQVGGQASADRYTYVPLIGVFIMLAWGIEQCSRRLPHRAVLLGVPVAGILALLITLTSIQTWYWRDSFGLFAHAVEVNPNNARMLDSLGSEYLAQGEYEEAVKYCGRAVEIIPDYPNGRTNLGSALLGMGRVDEAIAQYQEALRVDPNHFKAHYNLGNALLRKDLPAEAAKQYAEAIRIAPDFANAYLNLAVALERLDRLDDAIAACKEALLRDRQSASVRNKIAALEQSRQNRLSMLNQHARQAEANPGDRDSQHRLANELFRQGRYEEAVERYEATLSIDPEYAPAHSNLGNAFTRLGRIEEAEGQYREAIRLQPDFPDAYNNLGTALFLQKRYEEAAKAYSEAIRLKPEYVDAHFNLAVTLRREKKNDDAIREYQETLRLNPKNTAARAALEEMGVPLSPQ